MVSLRMESSDLPPKIEDNLPRLRTAPVSFKKDKEPAFSLMPDEQLSPAERGEFVTKYSTHIMASFRAMETLEDPTERQRARAVLLGSMFSELKMFGDPPPEDIPEAFIAAAQNPEKDEDAKHIVHLINDYEEHPVMMAIDTSIDRLGKSSRERVEAIQMLRGAAILIDRSYVHIPEARISE